MDLTLPFGPDSNQSRTWKLDESRKEQARSLASRLGISYAAGTAPALPSAATHPQLYELASDAIQQAGGPNFINPDHIVARKMHVQANSEETVYLNILAGLAGYLIFDLPDGQGGFVLIDPKRERTTAWHPERATREAACVCGSLVLREAKKKGLAEVDDLANALSSMAIDPETGMMKNLEAAFGHIDINTVTGNPQREPDVESITLTQVDLPNVNTTPNWMQYPHAAGAAETRAGAGGSSGTGRTNRLSTPW
ncbi:hypothetical protein DFS34DRAFT_615647 [Phlyctochytrium arcticum]|nr:hypothetical protein DFS34DRAFT_615647 [Phlyctochytrium arcticum]